MLVCLLSLILFTRSFIPFFFFFNDTATTEIYTLSLHDALPICRPRLIWREFRGMRRVKSSRRAKPRGVTLQLDRKSTRLNSSHLVISYAVFCLKKKKKKKVIVKTTKRRSCSSIRISDGRTTQDD